MKPPDITFCQVMSKCFTSERRENAGKNVDRVNLPQSNWILTCPSFQIMSLLLGGYYGIFMLAECCRAAKCRSLGISSRGSSSSAQARKSWKDWPLVTSSVSRSNQKVTTRYLELEIAGIGGRIPKELDPGLSFYLACTYENAIYITAF